MADQGTSGFQIPPEMRAFAERSVTQAKQAFDGFMGAAHGAVATLEHRATAASASAKDVQRKTVSFAEQNVDASFDFAKRLLAAKDTSEMVKLHGDYVKSQMQALSTQARELGEAATKAASPPSKD